MNTTRSPLLTLALLAMVLFLVFQLREARHMRVVQKTSPTADARTEPSSRSNRETEATLVYKRVSPSVVAVANNALVRRGFFFDFQIYEVPQGAGSGFVWDKKGHIVSNYHVVHQANRLTVTFPDGTQYDAKLVGIAPDYDLAVLYRCAARPARACGSGGIARP